MASLCVALSLAATGCGGTTGCKTDVDCTSPNPRCEVVSGQCVPCLPTADNCAKPTHCKLTAGAYACVTTCIIDGECTNGTGNQTCCGGMCVDTLTDNNNCGVCRTVCPSPDSGKVACTKGSCQVTSCTAGNLDCNSKGDDGCEVTPATDVKNCGACGKVCKSGANSTPVCKDSVCALTCADGHADCNGNLADGCEVDITVDLANCGACAVKCGPLTNAKAVCAMSMCSVASCTGTFGDCNAMGGDGCEVDLSADAKNCGACGKACKAVTNADVKCNDSACVFACKDGFGDCDNDPANGCETATTSDVNNCSGCGLTCSFPHATPNCVKSACGIDSCAMGFGDCDGKLINGCEVATGSDINNCGKCGNACGKDVNGNNRLCKAGTCVCAPCSIPNAATKCVVADCVFDMCNAGFGDCNKDLKDGCEADTLADVMNCGACGKACANGEFCRMGACTANPCVGKAGGPILMAQGFPYLGYCWYLGIGGASGDEVCAAAGGTNMSNDAINVLSDDCSGGAQGQLTQWFYENGNAEGWTGPYMTPTGYRTLGHGYTNGSLLGRRQAYAGRCNMGGIANVGAFPGEINDTKSPGGGNPDNNCRSVVVACDR